jgi:hypothetical protein
MWGPRVRHWGFTASRLHGRRGTAPQTRWWLASRRARRTGRWVRGCSYAAADDEAVAACEVAKDPLHESSQVVGSVKHRVSPGRRADTDGRCALVAAST